MKARCRDLEVAWFEVGRGPDLVLVHGLADDHRAWRKLIPHLALDHRLVMFDLRGHGQTTLGAPDGTLAQLSEDLVALMDAIGLERADLVGFSLGGTLVMRLAIDHPERVRRLLPVSTSSRVGRTAAGWYEDRAAKAEAGGGAFRAALEADTREQFANAPAELAEHLRMRVQSTADPRGFANACRAMAGLGAAPLDPELGRVEAPTLVVACDRDALCPPRAGEIITAGIPGSRLAIVEGSGHQVEVEKPRELAELINGFLRPGS